MKKYVPFKYVLGMVGLYVIMPVLMIYVLLELIGIYSFTIGLSLLFVGLIIIGPFVFAMNSENASVIIDESTITNYMNDGTRNFGWTEERREIKSIKIATKEEVQEVYKDCRAKKALLIDFGGHNIKYISVSLFTNSQISKMLKHLRSN